jgi:hypothetical protein
VTTVWPGNVTVDNSSVVTVLAGSCVVKVVVIPGRVIVDNTVEAGSCVVTVCVTAGKVIVERMVLAGNCVV